MKYSLVFLFVFLHQMTSAQKEHRYVNDTVVSWKHSDGLNWEDFQGKPTSNTYIGNAATSYKIVVLPEKVIVNESDIMTRYKELTAEARFYKKQSWTVSEDRFLLKHERLHFDIAELFARKIRHRFAELKGKKEAKFSKYYEEYKGFWKQCRAYQVLYDKQTLNGLSKSENEVWIKKIEKELSLLKKFAP